MGRTETFVPEPAKPHDYDRRLAARNPNVRVVWNGSLGVWEIQELGRVTKSWRYVMFWAVLSPPSPPKYLPLPPIEEVLRRLHEIDVERLGSTPMAQWGALCSDMDEKRREALAKHFAEVDAAGLDYAADLYARGQGIRQTFGPGGPRSRRGMGGGSDNMRRFMAEKAGSHRKFAPVTPFSKGLS